MTVLPIRANADQPGPATPITSSLYGATCRGAGCRDRAVLDHRHRRSDHRRCPTTQPAYASHLGSTTPVHNDHSASTPADRPPAIEVAPIRGTSPDHASSRHPARPDRPRRLRTNQSIDIALTSAHSVTRLTAIVTATTVHLADQLRTKWLRQSPSPRAPNGIPASPRMSKYRARSCATYRTGRCWPHRSVP